MDKKSTLFFLILCVVFISILGVFAIGFTNHEGHTTCPIAMSGNCSYMENVFAMAMHHIDSIQDFSEGTAISGFGIILLILAVAAVSLFIKPKEPALLLSKINFNFLKYKAHPVFTRILKWLSLNNKLDTHPQY
jgi:hypothetical protein